LIQAVEDHTEGEDDDGDEDGYDAEDKEDAGVAEDKNRVSITPDPYCTDVRGQRDTTARP
jgi:hypothetical protein